MIQEKFRKLIGVPGTAVMPDVVGPTMGSIGNQCQNRIGNKQDQKKGRNEILLILFKFVVHLNILFLNKPYFTIQ